MAAGPVSERNQDATIYVGGLDEKVNESLLWELFVQAGPVVNVHMPKDRVTMMHQGYGFVEFLTEEDADYSIKIMNMIKLYGKPIRVNKASAHQKNLDVGANIFIGNLDPEVDEKLLYDTFSAFGVILTTPKIHRDPETGNSKGYAFINYASFDASDVAIDSMNSQFLCNRAISINYAFKDGSTDRHGSAAERLLAAQNPLSQAHRPHQLFADVPNIPSTLSGPERLTGIRHGFPPIPPGLPKLPVLPPPPPGLFPPGVHPTRGNIRHRLPFPPFPLPPGVRIPPPPGTELPLPPGTGLKAAPSGPRFDRPLPPRPIIPMNCRLRGPPPPPPGIALNPGTRGFPPPPPFSWMTQKGEVLGAPQLTTGPPRPPPWLGPGGPQFRHPMHPTFRPPLPTGPPPG